MLILPETVVFPERTISGANAVLKLIPECIRFGKRGVLIHGQSLAQSGLLEKILGSAPKGVEVVAWKHGGGEPMLAHLEQALSFARKQKAEWIAGVGGGSVLDIAKACAGLFNVKSELSLYHDGAPIEKPGIPFVAAPTTAGTGSEATINAVLTNTEKRQKKSIRSPLLIAKFVILDPVLLASCPKETIAHAGLDAFTQAIEGYTSRMSTWLSDQYGLKAIELIAANLETVYSEKAGPDCQSGRLLDCTKPEGPRQWRGKQAVCPAQSGVPPCQRTNLDDSAEFNLLLGSYFAGLSFSMARLGVVHGLAHPLGVRYHAAHGLICGACLPHAIELNRPALGGKYEVISETIGDDLLTFTRRLLKKLDVVSPFKSEQIIEKGTIIGETIKSWSTAANPKTITESDVEFLLERLFGK